MNRHESPRALRRANRPKLGFLGVGWIGRARMQALLATGQAEAAAVVDPCARMTAEARQLVPEIATFDSLGDMLDHGVDAVVIATPSALHAEQAVAALDAGAAVFCQKPLGRSAGEVRAVVEAARRNDLPLGLDLSYRYTAAMDRIRVLVEANVLGSIHTIDLVFHNGYGPDKPWFYDRSLAGGGCLMDLGIHLVDLALWLLDFPKVVSVTGHLLQGGTAVMGEGTGVEDLALATLVTDGGTVIRIACSWKLNVGQDAEISATFHGTKAAARFANVGGSFYDFTATLLKGTSRETLTEGPDDWGGRAAARWLGQVAEQQGFDSESLHYETVAETLDRTYHSAVPAAPESPLTPPQSRGQRTSAD